MAGMEELKQAHSGDEGIRGRRMAGMTAPQQCPGPLPEAPSRARGACWEILNLADPAQHRDGDWVDASRRGAAHSEALTAPTWVHIPPAPAPDANPTSATWLRCGVRGSLVTPVPGTMNSPCSASTQAPRGLRASPVSRGWTFNPLEVTFFFS